MIKSILGLIMVAVMAQAVTLKTQQRAYDVGQDIRVDVTQMAGNDQDWIGLYHAGAGNNVADAVEWKFTNGIQDGHVFFQGITTEGAYEARVFFNNTYNVEATYAFTIQGVQAGATIASNKEVYTPNESLTFTMANMSGDAKDWIGIYPVGASNAWENVASWSFTNGVVNGDLTLSGVPAGNYEARAFFRNSYSVETVDTFSVQAVQAGTTIAASKDVYVPNEALVFTMANMSGDAKDWIGIYPVGASNAWENVVSWKYTSGVVNGDLTLTGIPAGNYEARAFFKNSYNVESTDTFSVQAVQVGTTIAASKAVYTPNEALVFTMANMSGDAKDWIGVYPVGASNAWENVVSWKYTNGVVNGDLTLTGIVAGNYEARAFFKNSYNVESTVTFSVQGVNNEAGLKINEVMASNGHTIIDPDFEAFSDWIELYNGSDTSIDISGYKLGNTVNAGTWTFPAGTVVGPKSYRLIWADKEDTSLTNDHTDFSLKQKGSAVGLFDANNVLIDSLEFAKQKTDVSCMHNGASVGYTIPTPKGVNKPVLNDSTLSDAPSFSQEGGFYNAAQSVTLSGNGVIHYTTDGSFPTVNAPVYAAAIAINNTTTIKAMSVEAGKLPSEVMTHTYFIGESSTLPVVSLTTDSAYLFDDTIGIYTVGTNGADRVCGGGQANYMQEWKRPAHIEFFDANKNIGFNQEVTIKMSGTCSLERGEKSFSIKADKKYGKKNISYKIFPDKEITKFKSIKLRNGGQDWHKGMMRDAMIQNLIKDDTDLDYEAYQPVLLFLNGEYWGIYNIREKKNEDYLAANHPGLDDKNVDILYGPSAKVKEGDNVAYKAMISYLNNNSLVSAANYQVIADQVDIANYIDYLIIETYAANSDWVFNNVRYYKEKKAGAKWRWILDDLDSGFNLHYSDPDEFGLQHNTIGYALSYPTENPAYSSKNQPRFTILTRKLMENAGFKSQFIARYRQMLNTTFAPAHVNAVIAQMKATIEPEMARHIQRWQSAAHGYVIGYSGKSNWDRYIGYLNDFANDRPDIVRGHLTALEQ